MAASIENVAVTRRALLRTLPAALVPFAMWPFDERESGAGAVAETGDSAASLMQAICAHCAAYSDVGRLSRKVDTAASGLMVNFNDTSALDVAIDLERRLFMSLCAYPASNDAERHDKATYLLGIFEGDEPSSEHVTALLISMRFEAPGHSVGDALPTREA